MSIAAPQSRMNQVRGDKMGSLGRNTRERSAAIAERLANLMTCRRELEVITQRENDHLLRDIGVVRDQAPQGSLLWPVMYSALLRNRSRP